MSKSARPKDLTDKISFGLRPKKKICLFPVTRPTVWNHADQKIFFLNFGDRRLPISGNSWTFFDFSSETVNTIQQNLTGSKISMSFIMFVLFGLIGKSRRPPWPLIGWDMFNFSSETAEQNSMKLDVEARSQCPLPSLCILHIFSDSDKIERILV